MSESFLGVVHLPTYVLGTLLVILLPGPNSLFVLGLAARQGVRQGYLAACGIFIGDAVLMSLAAAGVASVLKTSLALFTVFKYCGAAYLAYLGVNMMIAAWKIRGTAPAESLSSKVVAGSREAHPLLRALTISLMNPKAILFCVAFFIQFVDPAYPHQALSFLLLGAIAQSMSALYLSLLIFSGVRLAAAFRRRHRTRALTTGSAGALFVGFGVKLATASVN